MAVVGVLNSKGGVGKSTLAAALAVAAAEDGTRSALVDLDPQGSLRKWHGRRGTPDNPALYVGAEFASDALERLERTEPAAFVFLDGPPGSLAVTRDGVEVSDLTIIPVRAYGVDLESSMAVVRHCTSVRRPYLIVFNAVAHSERGMLKAAREDLIAAGVPADNVADVAISHRIAHGNNWVVGRTGSETDKAAAAEVATLWADVRRRLPRKARRSK